jgi:hypothetical protein
MGTTVNGVYEPAIGETAWGALVNANLDAFAQAAVNARLYLKGDGSTEDPAQIVKLQADALGSGGVGKHVMFPSGIYVWPDGVSFDLANSMHVAGAGRRNTFITVKNSYAFTGTAIGDCVLRDIHVSQRSGATTGGAVKFDSAAACKISAVDAESVSSCTDPGIWLKGTVGSHIDGCHAQGSTAPGIRLDPTGATLGFCNANTVYRSRVNSIQGSTTPAIYGGGSGNAYRDNIIEANRGYGLYIDGSTHDTVEGNWFEDNSNHNLYVLNNALAMQVVGNKFHYNHGDIGTAEHIKLTGTANGRHIHRIEGNTFQDPSSSGTAIDIGTNVEFTLVVGNRGAGITDGTSISDLGSYTMIMGNDSTAPFGDVIQFPGGSTFRKLPNIKTNRAAAALGGNPASAEAQFVVSDSTGTNYVVIGSRGYQVFRTGSTLTSSDELQTNSFAFYWDEAAGQIKARVRNNAGAYSTLIVA